jgi:hypothetical protein
VERGQGIPREREVDKRGRGKWIRGERFVSRGGECDETKRVYMCTENPGISVEFLSLALSLSLSLLSLRNQN